MSKLILIRHGQSIWNNVLVAAHGNSLRSIVMQLDRLSPELIPNLELATGVPIIYDVDDTEQATNKITLN